MSFLFIVDPQQAYYVLSAVLKIFFCILTAEHLVQERTYFWNNEHVLYEPEERQINDKF